jgi:hypothetical protein
MMLTVQGDAPRSFPARILQRRLDEIRPVEDRRSPVSYEGEFIRSLGKIRHANLPLPIDTPYFGDNLLDILLHALAKEGVSVVSRSQKYQLNKRK